jgi:adenosylmethionine-8-amino-7-oxononanoate aminotransferase
VKKIAKKMTLNRETVGCLNAETLAKIAGGTSPDPPSQSTCVRTICPNRPETTYCG